MAGSSFTIPVLDVSAISLKVSDELISVDEIKLIGDELKNALSQTGVCYLKNHGIGTSMIEKYRAASKYFFTQPDGVKQRHALDVDRKFGWIALETEQSNPERPGDLKEAFNYVPSADNRLWGELEEFHQNNVKVFDACKSLSTRLLDCLSVGLGLDKKFMATAHKSMGSKNNFSTLRSLYYPPILPGSALKPSQVRIGEHTDFGTLTLLFQDNVGGLEADLFGKGFVPVIPISDTVVVFSGDFMQMWTSGTLSPLKHRVDIPEAAKDLQLRQTVVFFIHPDDEQVMQPINSKNASIPTVEYGTYIRRCNRTALHN